VEHVTDTLLHEAEQELEHASSDAAAVAALRKQLHAALKRAGDPPVPRNHIPHGLWNAEWARAEIARELAAPQTFTAWRLGWWAKLLPVDEQSDVLDAAIDQFEAIVATPAGPGNDAGPFCDIAQVLSRHQAQRALTIVERMKANWGEEALVAEHMLTQRLIALGHDEDVPASYAFAIHHEVRSETQPKADVPGDSGPSRRAQRPMHPSALLAGSEAQIWAQNGGNQRTLASEARAKVVRLWNKGLRAALERAELQQWLIDSASLLRQIAGQAAVDVCRTALVGE